MTPRRKIVRLSRFVAVRLANSKTHHHFRFEWLDAFEEKTTDFWISFQKVDAAGEGPLTLEKSEAGLAGPGFEMPLH